MASIFSKIIAGEIPSRQVYKDELVTAFWDINPARKVHILIVPNKEIPTVNEIDAEDEQTMGRLFTVAKKIAAELGIAESGYRLIVNVNGDGGQEVYHIHMHLIGGEKVGPMTSRKES